jgi:hypothetical protein
MDTARPARDLATLAAEIRHAWLVASAAIPFPPEIAGAPGILDKGLDDPRVAAILNARQDAFGWALSEMVDGEYAAPGYQVAALSHDVLPQPLAESEAPGDRLQKDDLTTRAQAGLDTPGPLYGGHGTDPLT